MKKSKILPYIIFGVPLLIGGFFVYKAIKANKKNKEQGSGDATGTTGGTSTGTGSTGSGSTGTGSTSSDGFPSRKGNRGSIVTTIQRGLSVQAGIPTLVQDGIFGNKTESAVKQFQRMKNLSVDGVVGKNTWRAIFGAEYPSTGNLFAPPPAPQYISAPPVNQYTPPTINTSWETSAINPMKAIK